MSIFDGIDFSELTCQLAQKSIADDWDRKHIITRLEFKDFTGTPVFAVRSSYSIDDHMQTLFNESIKISCDHLKSNRKLRVRSFGEHDLTEEIKKDLADIEKLFHTAPDETKRVY